MRSLGMGDGGIYHKSQPTAHNQFRANTKKHATMVGVNLPLFVCKFCGKRRPLMGRKRVDATMPKLGFMCSDCAPVEPVVVKSPAKAKPAVFKPEPPAKARNTLMTDEQVLECRADYEFNGVKPQRLARRYGVTAAYMRALLDYATRSKLIPKQPHK